VRLVVVEPAASGLVAVIKEERVYFDALGRRRNPVWGWKMFLG